MKHSFANELTKFVDVSAFVRVILNYAQSLDVWVRVSACEWVLKVSQKLSRFCFCTEHLAYRAYITAPLYHFSSISHQPLIINCCLWKSSDISLATLKLCWRWIKTQCEISRNSNKISSNRLLTIRFVSQ